MTLQIRVGVEWINTFPDSGSCHQNNLSYRDDHGNGFYNAMGNRGHIKVFNWGNNNAYESDFRHPDHGGHSLDWIDNVHFMFYSDHGGNWSNTMHLAFAVAHDYCLASSNQWRLGPKMLKWFVLDCCQAVLNTDTSHIISTWGGPMSGGIHMIFGFIGNGTDSWWNSGLGSDFGDDAGRGLRLANAWLDRAYSWWLDDDAIAIAAGATAEEAINRRDNETINWRDYNVTACRYLYWKYRC